MDPQVCLLECETAINNGDSDLAARLLDDYVNWRGIGGNEPRIYSNTLGKSSGDYFYHELIRRYETKFGPYLDGRLP